MGLGQSAPIDKTVVIIGASYAGLTLAQALDPLLNVIVIEKKEAFVHSVGGLRAAVNHDWSKVVIIPYNKALARGKFKQGEATSIDKEGKTVVLASGETIKYDFLVLATGASPFLLGRVGNLTTIAEFHAHYAETAQAIAKAERILVVGGGAVGVELVGELKTAYPTKDVTLVHSGAALLSGGPPNAPPAFQANVLNIVKSKGIKVVLNERVDFDRSKLVIPVSKSSSIKTTPSGTPLDVDLILNASGIPPTKEASPLLASLGSDVLDAQHFIKTNQYLQVGGEDSVIYAIGDCTSPPWGPEAKTIVAVKMSHVPTVTKNILAQAKGTGKLKPGAAAFSLMMLPVGANAGAGYAGKTQLPGFLAVSLKGKDLMATGLWGELKQPAPSPLPPLTPSISS